jgi:dipeptidyl aminopeptidase/acylaminoacyl peptidase
MRALTLLFVMVTLLLCSSAVAQSRPPRTDGSIISRQPYVQPSFQDGPTIRRYLDSATYTSAVNDRTVRTEKIFYYSDGLKVAAYLITPAEQDRQSYPVIIFNRGSDIRNDIGYVYAAMFRKFVRAGFIVVAPALRGSEGGEGTDQMGGDDLHDIMNVVPMLTSLGIADTSRMFMVGESRGGIMTYLAMKNNFPMKAAVTIGAITDLGAFIQEFPQSEQLLTRVYPEYPKNKQQVLRERSALNWAEALNVPVLLLNGQADPQVKPYHALNLAQRLAELKKPFQLVILEGGNHNLTWRSAEERDRQILEWCRKYL